MVTSAPIVAAPPPGTAPAPPSRAAGIEFAVLLLAMLVPALAFAGRALAALIAALIAA
jgi:hypothetical protein